MITAHWKTLKERIAITHIFTIAVCVTFANVYNQLLTQVGIKTTTATCEYDATILPADCNGCDLLPADLAPFVAVEAFEASL